MRTVFDFNLGETFGPLFNYFDFRPLLASTLRHFRRILNFPSLHPREHFLGLVSRWRILSFPSLHPREHSLGLTVDGESKLFFIPSLKTFSWSHRR
ncbi:hypothetical protein CEXT_220761 [Caerostris extrusa]|uniref:Uncharacterized protein n=1 Tax=Caerostris extrusa TaxID=172846 RepID=A0AAV4THH2_CAEEX|nr:hypothetical protein CEXT_220761 [Caerostris extrusa]